MKVFSMSQRIYYKDLEPEAESIIKKDLELYNCMLHKAFKICFDRAYKDVTYSDTDQRMIKSFYGTSDYFPLSAVNVDNDMLTYRSTQKDIVFKVQFHKYKDELYARVNGKHNSPNKAVAYELMDYGEYFIVKAIFKKHMNLPKTDTLYGAVGIDINVDHIALCETNKDGNIVLIKKYPIHKENTKNKRNEELYQLAIEIMGQCESKKKSLVVEDLNFKQLKTRMLYRPKKQNKTLSSFAYKKILEKLERKCLMNEVDVIKVDPKNTSKIGKEKYTKIKGLSVHYCAAYVINPRGMGFVD